MSVPALSRRDFFRRAVVPDSKKPHSPPWTSERTLTACTSCGDCVRACPEQILQIGQGANARPYVDMSKSGCTFCGECASACNEDVFGNLTAPPWNLTIRIASSCILENGISCQLCTDFCDEDALHFDMSVRPVGALRVDRGACTGCGFCLAPCPVSAITLALSEKAAA